MDNKDNKNADNMDKFLELVEQVKDICSKIVKKQKQPLNGSQLSETNAVVKKTG